MALQQETGRTTEQIVSQFLLKTLHAILSSRIPYIHGRPPETPGNRQQHRRRDRWFHLALGDPPPALEHPSGLLPAGVMEPLVVDILLSPRDDPTAGEPVVERWTAQCEAAPPWSPFHSPAETSSNSFLVKKTYKKSIILLRSIYSILRLLPAYRFFRMLCASNQSYNCDMSYRVSSFAEPFSREEESRLRTHTFAPVETQFGQLAVSVQYRPSLTEFNLEISSLLPPMLITDYVGSPAADPMRAFPSSPSDRGPRAATSFPLRAARPSTSAPASAPLFNRPNSWTSAPIESQTSRLPAQQQQAGPTRRSSLTFDEFRLSPPFSLSPTPSPPTFSGSYLQSRLRSETAPVSIPQSGGGRGPQVHRSPNLSDPTRNFLPPPSPKSIRVDPSAQESPSESRSFRKSEGVKMGDVLSNLYSAPKVLKDGRDDSGRFSGAFSSGGSPRFGFSRSSSRLSVQDDLDDADFSYPFAVDDVDTSDSQTRSNEGKETSEFGPASSSHKSQDAAVGVLVHMLRTAAPLRDSSYMSPHSSKSELLLPEEQQQSLAGGAASSFFMSRKTSDALEELQSYKEIKEILLSQSRTKLHDSLKR